MRARYCALPRAILVTTLFAAASAAQAIAPALHWHRGTRPGPALRYAAPMAFDLHRGCMVLFGGATLGALFADTWELDDGGWRMLAPAHQPRAGAHALAYDVRRQRTVLLAFGHPMTTWEWDGVDWSQVHSGGITPRVGTALAYDLLRGVTVAFGGALDVTALGDTWEWDGSSWTLRRTGGPEPRFEGHLAYDLARGVTVLFGGSRIDHWPLADTWEWDGMSWVDRNVPGPSPRRQAALAYDLGRQRCVLVGGIDVYGTYLREVWEWDSDSWSVAAEPMPMLGSVRPSLGYDAARDRMIAALGGGPNLSGDPDWWIGVSFAAPAAAASEHGTGCGAQSPRLAQLPGQLPQLGSRCQLEIRGLPPSGRGLLFGLAGLAPADGRSVSLPLAPYGFPGCELALDPWATTPLVQAGAGAAWPVPVPWEPLLLGLQLDLQILYAGPAATLLLSNGLRLRLGL